MSSLNNAVRTVHRNFQQSFVFNVKPESCLQFSSILVSANSSSISYTQPSGIQNPTFTPLAGL